MVETLADIDIRKAIEEFQDHLAPRLDTYEQAIYLYVFRHSRLLGKTEVTIGFKSAVKKMSFGVGAKGTRIAEGTCYEKLRSLVDKGCLEILDTVRDGTKIRVKLPAEIPGVIPAHQQVAALSLEDMDFFNVSENRVAILRREGNQCFYCLRSVDSSNYVIEHVTSRPDGNNSYRNVVAACRNCNNRKGSATAEDYLRSLYRTGFLSTDEFEGRQHALNRLKSGELKPES